MFVQGSLALIHLPPWTKWPPFRRRCFEIHFLQRKLLCFYSNFTEICLQVLINNNPAVVQIMAWLLTGDKPLSEPMLTQLTSRGTRGR